MILPELQTTMAKNIGATIVNLQSSHVPMLSQPAEVTAAILAAVGQR
jgi:hypothetical protein